MKINRCAAILFAILGVFGCDNDSNGTSNSNENSSFGMKVGTTYWDSTTRMRVTINGVQTPIHIVAVPGDKDVLYFVVSDKSLPLYHSNNEGDRYRIVAKKVSSTDYGGATYSIDTSISLIDNKYKFISGNISVSSTSQESKSYSIGFTSSQDPTRAYTSSFYTNYVMPSGNAIFEMGF